MRRFDHKIALVTGGASGIGRAIAQCLVANGAKVVITDTQEELGRETAVRDGVTFIEQDVCDETQWTRVVGEVEDRFGSLNILVNNAGIFGPLESAPLEHAQLANWQMIFSVNVYGVFLGCKAAIEAMKSAGGGSIINMSSIAGLLATPYAAAYGASKAAVRQLTKSVAQYCTQERLNIRCNSVHPGDVRTPLWDKQAQEIARTRGIRIEEVVAEAVSASPMGQLPTPEDVAAAVAFLASDDARYMTGAKIIVDGGIVNCDTFHLMSRTRVDCPTPHANGSSQCL